MYLKINNKNNAKNPSSQTGANFNKIQFLGKLILKKS
jgi:hypothetical protein